MRHRAVLNRLLLAGFFLAALAPSTRADFMTAAQTESIPLTLTDWSPTTASLAGKNPFVIQQFNAATYQPMAPAGKTVLFTGVAVSLTYQFQNTISMRFDNVSTITVNASGEMHLGLNGLPITDLVGKPTFATSATQTSTAGNTFPKNVTVPTKVVNGLSSMGYTAANGAVFTAFAGSGSVSLPVVATATSSFTTSSGNGKGTSDTSALASISVVYFYQFVPEPSSMALTGLGGVGLVLAFRKRVSRKD